jgi:signal transduction histidine kinase
MKHAQAKNTRIEIVKGPDHLELIISDNGVGISDNTCNKLRSFGLRGIHERAAHLGGTVKISSNLERGTQIAIFIPLDAGYTSTNSIQQQLFDATTA